MSDSEEEDAKLRELEEIKKYADYEKEMGNSMFVSGWDDDADGVDPARNPSRGRELAMLEAAENGEIETLRRLFGEESSLLHVRDEDGYTPLHRASYNDKVNAVEYLISVGADVGAKTEDGWTPLHSACHWNNAMSAAKLIEGGADINAATEGGQTALHLAAAHGATKDCLELLIMHPLIKINLKNNAGETPLDIAKRSGRYAVLFEIHEQCLQFVSNAEAE